MHEFVLDCRVNADSEPALFAYIEHLNLRWPGHRRFFLHLLQKATSVTVDDINWLIDCHAIPKKNQRRNRIKRLRILVREIECPITLKAVTDTGFDKLKHVDIVCRLEVAAAKLRSIVLTTSAMHDSSTRIEQSSPPPPPLNTSTSHATPSSIREPEHMAGVIGSVMLLENSCEIPFEALEEFFQGG